MHKHTIGGAALVAASVILLGALPQNPARAQLAPKYSERLQALVGKSFGIDGERQHAFQDAGGEYKLVGVAADYAEFQAEDLRLLVPLSVLRVTLESK
jgi:hypothetical protein